MSARSKAGGFIWRIMKKLNPLLLGRFRSGVNPGRLILLLTTTGRKSGRDHVTPLQYEQVGEAYYVGSARGHGADWCRNILANPEVKVEIEGESFEARAEVIIDAEQIADFIELRLKKRPRMIGTLLRLEGLPAGFTRQQLEVFATKKAVVVLTPKKA